MTTGTIGNKEFSFLAKTFLFNTGGWFFLEF